MFRFGCCCSLLLASLGFSEELRQTTAVPISLYTRFQQNPPPAVMNAVHDELTAIMEPIGMQFEWRDLNGVRGSEVSVELAVITFKGRCNASDLVFQARNPGALGWTHVSDGAILPFADVDCDRIREFTQRELLFVAPEQREWAYGRAIGRVLAHELFHIFANTAHHASGGVAKSAYSVQELLSDDFLFGEGETLALKRSPARLHTENAGNLPAPTPPL